MKFPVHKSLQNTTGNAGFSTTAICTCNQNSRHRFHIFHILIHLHITFPRLFTFFILERVRSVDKNHLNPCLPAGFHFHINATRFSTVFRNKYFCLCFPNKPHICLLYTSTFSSGKTSLISPHTFSAITTTSAPY